MTVLDHRAQRRRYADLTMALAVRTAVVGAALLALALAPPLAPADTLLAVIATAGLAVVALPAWLGRRGRRST